MSFEAEKKGRNSKYPELAVSPEGPVINDPQFKAEIVFKGLRYSTSMVFLGPSDILVAEKWYGNKNREWSHVTTTFARC